MNIKEAKVIITGGSTGIGFETARLLKENGATVLISSRNEARLEKAAKELGVLSFRADMSQENDVKALFAFAIKELGSFNVLINNAGVALAGSNHW